MDYNKQQLNDRWEALVKQSYQVDVCLTLVDEKLIDVKRWKEEVVLNVAPVPRGTNEPDLKSEFLEYCTERYLLMEKDEQLRCLKITNLRREITNRADDFFKTERVR